MSEDDDDDCDDGNSDDDDGSCCCCCFIAYMTRHQCLCVCECMCERDECKRGRESARAGAAGGCAQAALTGTFEGEVCLGTAQALASAVA